jgi:hypothetical protein
MNDIELMKVTGYNYTKDETKSYTYEDQHLKLEMVLKGNALNFPSRYEVEEAVKSLLRGAYGYENEDE